MAWDLTCFDVDGDIETFYTYRPYRMEGCDEPEWTMYNRVTAAIEDYWMKKFNFKLKDSVDSAIEDTIAQMPNALKMLEDS